MRDRVRAGSFAAGVLLLAALAGAGCGPRVAAVPEKAPGARTYERTTEALTRTKEVRDGLETRFIVSAAWLTPRWAHAFSEEYARIYDLDAARREQVSARWRGESDKYERFLVALFTPDDRINDLDKSGTTWSLRFVGGGDKDYAPVYVKRTDLRPEEVARFFSFVGTWSRAYEVAFPKQGVEGPGPERAVAPRGKLVLTGVQGRAVLAWD